VGRICNFHLARFYCRRLALIMKNDYEEFKDSVSRRYERHGMTSLDETRGTFWSSVAIWLVLLGIVGAVWTHLH
jgi:hypothetical protein